MGMYGIQRIDMVKDCLILAGAGVGGGSLVYANTLYEPLDAFYRDPSWAHITDWKTELAPYYDQAKRMLGVVENPRHTPSDEVMKQVAEEMGVGDTFHPTPVGVFFGGPDAQGGEEVADPYFGGAGPARNACLNCGECMTGCRHNAKNTLVKNYLHLAEQAGAVVHPLTTVTRVRPRSAGGYEVTTRWTKAKLSRLSRNTRPRRRSPPTRSSSPPPRSAPRSCSTSSRTTVTCRRSATGSACSPAPTPRRSSARSRPAGPPTSPRAWRSRRRGTPTRSPTSSRAATARGPTRWPSCRRSSPTTPPAPGASARGCASCGASGARRSTSTTSSTGRSARSSRW